MTLNPHVQRQAYKTQAIDGPMHWHLVAVKEDGSSATLHIYTNWNHAELRRIDENRQDSKRQWASPVRTTRYIHQIHACWQGRCMNIRDI